MNCKLQQTLLICLQFAFKQSFQYQILLRKHNDYKESLNFSTLTSDQHVVFKQHIFPGVIVRDSSHVEKRFMMTR